MVNTSSNPKTSPIHKVTCDSRNETTSSMFNLNRTVLAENGRGKLLLERILAKVAGEKRGADWSDYSAWDKG